MFTIRDTNEQFVLQEGFSVRSFFGAVGGPLMCVAPMGTLGGGITRSIDIPPR